MIQEPFHFHSSPKEAEGKKICKVLAFQTVVYSEWAELYKSYKLQMPLNMVLLNLKYVFPRKTHKQYINPILSY